MESKAIRLKSLVVGPFGSNCYVMGSDAGEGIVVDPGADAKSVLKAVEKLKLDIKLIVATHGHIDHVGAVKEVKEATGAQFAMHEADVYLLADGGGFLSFLPPSSFSIPPPPEIFLTEGDKVEVAGISLDVLNTPGHSSGGISLLGHGAVFTGDTLFCQGIGRFDFPGSSGNQLLESIHNKLMTLPDKTIVYPGHGPKTTIGDERHSNPFLRPGVVF